MPFHNTNLKPHLIATLLFCFFFSFYCTTINVSAAQHSDDFLLDNSISNQVKTQLISPESSSSSSISLAMGRVLGSLEMSAYSVVLSKDGNTAFVSLTRSGHLKIIDVSNLENPIVLNTMMLRPVDYPFLGKFLALSPDGKTLFASNMQRLEIMDISDLEIPAVLGELEDKEITKRVTPSRGTTEDYRVSMAVSKDNATLYVGGLGLQIIDISDSRKPRIISSNSTLLGRNSLYLTEITISSDREILYLANGTLNIYNISKNPRILTPVGSYSLPSAYFISSVILSKKDKIAYIAAHIQGGETIFEKIDISDLSKPTKLSSYNLNLNSALSPSILGLCGGNENFAFILVQTGKYNQDVGVFNLKKNEFRLEAASLIKGATSLVSFQDESKIMIAQDNARFMTVEFFAVYPNKRIFSFSNNSIGSLTTRTDLPIDSSILFSDGKTLMVRRGGISSSKYILELVDVSNYSAPVLLGSFEENSSLKSVKLLEQAKKVLITYERKNIALLDLSDLTQPIVLGKFSLPNTNSYMYMRDARLSSDAKRGFIITTDGQRLWILWIIDFSDPTTSFENGKILKDIPFASQIDETILTKNNNILLLLGRNITIVNVTNPQKPVEISTILADQDGEPTDCKFAALSPDEKTLFARVYFNKRYSLKIYDVRDFSAIKYLGELSLPAANKEIVFSSDYKTAYLRASEGYLLVINISNTSSPFVQGTFYLPDAPDFKAIQLAQDDKTLFYAMSNTLKVASLAVPQTLYLDTESVRLGQKYRETVSLFSPFPATHFELRISRKY